MTGMPMVPAWLDLPPTQRLDAVMAGAQKLVERAEFWLVMQDVWWLRPLASFKLSWLTLRINDECSMAESMLPKPTVKVKLVAVTASTSDPLRVQTFIDCAGIRHARATTGY